VAATEGLPTRPAGPGSEELPGGVGPLPYDDMRQYLRDIRVYLYTGTRPASYTLGLIEAMMTGVPVVSISRHAFEPEGLYEADWICEMSGHGVEDVNGWLRLMLQSDVGDVRGELESERVRRRAIDLFGLDKIMGQWAEFLA